MFILVLRTDKPESELCVYDDGRLQCGFSWPAHRQLAETIHLQIAKILQSQGGSFSLVQGIVVYKGPGSFTGLRIGIATANAMADSLAVPIVGTASEDWQMAGIKLLNTGKTHGQVVPDYGSEAHTTTQKR